MANQQFSMVGKVGGVKAMTKRDGTTVPNGQIVTVIGAGPNDGKTEEMAFFTKGRKNPKDANSEIVDNPAWGLITSKMGSDDILTFKGYIRETPNPNGGVYQNYTCTTAVEGIEEGAGSTPAPAAQTGGGGGHQQRPQSPAEKAYWAVLDELGTSNQHIIQADWAIACIARTLGPKGFEKGIPEWLQERAVELCHTSRMVAGRIAAEDQGPDVAAEAEAAAADA